MCHLQASYAMGYNLAIEYLADYEKTWMLDTFRQLNDTVLVPQGRPLSKWAFLEVGKLPLPSHIVFSIAPQTLRVMLSKVLNAFETQKNSLQVGLVKIGWCFGIDSMEMFCRNSCSPVI